MAELISWLMSLSSARRTRRRGGKAAECTVPGCRSSLLASRSGTSNQKTDPAPRFESTPDHAPHDVHEPLADGESQPRAAVAAGDRGVSLTEPFEQQRQRLARKPDAGIGHGNTQLLGLGIVGRRDRDGSALREFDGIGQEIQQDLP